MTRFLTSRADLQARTFDFVETARNCACLPDLNQAFGRFLRDLGFREWFLGRVMRAPRGSDHGYSDAIAETSLEWLGRYMARGYVSQDRVPKIAIRRQQAFSWREAADERPMNRMESLIYQEAREFGLPNGVCVPAHMIDGSIWAVSANWRHGEPERATIEATEVAACYFASRALTLGRFTARPSGGGGDGPVLSGRQRDVVMALAGGQTQAGAARLLGVSVKRVEGLLADARDRMGARTTAHLMTLAAARREFDPGEVVACTAVTGPLS